MSAELEQVTLAVAAINKVESGLAALRETYACVVYEVKTAEGMELARAARRAIREPRFEVERIRKAAKAPILALGKQLDAEAARITRELTLIEAPIDAVITAEEQRKEKEKQARIDAEVARVAQMQRFIDGIREWPVNAAGKHSSLVSQMVSTATDYEITEEVFQERTDEAKAVLRASLAALNGIYAERVAHEAAQRKIEEDRKELARLQAEEAERQRIAAAERAKQEAADQAKRDAEAAAQAEANRVQREAIEREAAESRRIAQERQDELDRQAAEQRATRVAEEQRLADQRAEVERQQEALRVAQLPRPPARKIKHNPGAEALTDVIAQHYNVEPGTASRWLREIDWESVSA